MMMSRLAAVVMAGLLVPLGGDLAAETLRSRPNPALTPGVTRPLTVKEACGTKWGRDRRAVTTAMKRRVAQAYHVPFVKGIGKRVEFDHLIPRELLGADDEKNLWPQPWVGQWNAHQKDRLENVLHRRVCAGTLSLAAAQQAIREDWIAAYRRFVR